MWEGPGFRRGSGGPPLCLVLTLGGDAVGHKGASTLATHQVEQKPVTTATPTGLGHRTGWWPSWEPGQLGVWLRHQYFVLGTAAGREPGHSLRQTGLGS